MTAKCPSKACICASMTAWLVLASCALLISCVVVVGPYITVSRYRNATCRVESSYYTTQYVCRGDQGKSLYPCLLVQVTLNWTDARQWTMALYTDDLLQRSVIDASSEKRQRCSVSVCNIDENVNRQTIAEFRMNYGQAGSVFYCLYDPWDVNVGAVLQIRQSGLRVFHSIFWPGCALLMGTAVCFMLVRTNTFKEEKSELEDKLEEKAETPAEQPRPVIWV